ncbi:hypothetical protein SKAU_G00052260 [Synaphobranchus kaupii]|uniref:Uncharacterized protein n=1 Tax=Synaphobranchus kaupii TaxID=118154 RepID=A0A9Q1G441_SYNKA|nr:hypothetical protein SKAU_G00052260 [Synaphobranchus kaupii]
MWNRSGARSSALERAQAQLSGRRVFNKSDDSSTDELREYMDALIKKKNMLQVRHTYDDLSDISSDDRESEHNNPATGIAQERLLLDSLTERPGGGEGSRFLKKMPPYAVTSSQSPTLSRAGMLKEASRSLTSSRQGSQSAALSRLALIEDRFRNRFQSREGRVTGAPAREETPPSAQSSGELSMQGSRFLKKKSASVTQQQDPVPVKGQQDQCSSAELFCEIRSLDELFPGAPPSDDTISEKSEMSDEFKINIMIEKKKTKADSAKKTESSSFSLNVVLADDVLSEEEIQPAEAKVEYESDFDSEIQTEAGQSASEISEHLGRRDKDACTATSESHGISERSISYSSRSESNRSDGSHGGSRRGSHLRSSPSASPLRHHHATP